MDAAWGSYEKKDSATTLTVHAGALPLRALELPYYEEVTSVLVDGQDVSFTFRGGRINLSVTAAHSIVVSGK